MSHALFIHDYDQKESNSLLIAALVLSIAAHILFAYTTAVLHQNQTEEAQWVELVMEVMVPEPPPPPACGCDDAPSEETTAPDSIVMELLAVSLM